MSGTSTTAIKSKRVKKRTFNEFCGSDDDIIALNEGQPAAKKQKTEEIASKVSSNIFLNDADHQQFIKNYNAIKQSQFIINSKLSDSINQQIAEFATGEIKNCSANECNAEILILPSHFIQNALDATDFKHCKLWNKYWCKQCMKEVTENYGCDRECKYNGSLYFEPDHEKCPWCKCSIIGDCKCYRGGCDRCNRKWCYQCIYQEPWNKCKICYDNICHDCGNWEKCPLSNYECLRCKGEEEEDDEEGNGGKCPKCGHIIEQDLDEHFIECFEDEDGD